MAIYEVIHDFTPNMTTNGIGYINQPPTAFFGGLGYSVGVFMWIFFTASKLITILQTQNRHSILINTGILRTSLENNPTRGLRYLPFMVGGARGFPYPVTWSSTVE